MTKWFSPPTAIPDKPQVMQSAAADEWFRVTPYLEASKRITNIDRQTLIEYCYLWQQFIDLREAISDDADILLVQQTRHRKAENPLLKPLIETGEALLTKCISFGMTPKSRDIRRSAKQTPVELQKLRGNPSKRPLAASIVTDLDMKWDSIPTPEFLNERETQDFLHMREELELCGMFCPLDVAPAAVACASHYLFVEANVQRRSCWVEQTSRNGEDDQLKANPLFTSATKLATLTEKVRVHFGMSPKYRTVQGSEEFTEEAKQIPLRFGK